MKKTILLFALLIIGSITEAQIYPVIHYNRPRIYIDSSRWAFLHNNMNTGDCGVTYNAFNNAVFNNWYNDPQLYLLGTDSTLWTWDFTDSWAQDQGQIVAALFKINGDSTALKRCRFVITAINNKLDTIHFNNYDWYTNENLIRNIADVGGMLLDWCYNLLPVPMRQHLAQNLYKVDSYFMNNYILTSAGTAYVTGHNIWNVYYANQYALMLDSADGLNTLQLDSIRQWYEVSYDKAVNEILPAAGYYRDDDGGWDWTAAYGMWSLVDEFQFFENMRIATGKNFYTDLPWLQNSINQYWYFLQPDGWTINWGDGYTNVQGDRAIYEHAGIYHDARSVWLAQYWSQIANITWTWPLFQKLLYKDFSAATITKPDIAHDWFSDKTGLSVSRTDWSDTATMVWVYDAPTKKAGHEHRDNNTFCIYKNAPQINNSGWYYSYGDAHYINYYMRTIAHNSICVYDSTDVYTNWGVNVSNDGGQNESPTLMNFSDIFSPAAQKGSWELWGAGSDYCYNISDAAQSYDTIKLDMFRRRVLFYKPNQVIVLDHLHLKNIATHQRNAKFILHFQKQPAISGSIINTAVPNHIETYNGHDILQANGKGNVAVRTLLPVNSTTTRIGGTGYEFYVDGINYPESGITDSTHTTAGAWRIEVSPTTDADSLVFLHTIAIGDSTNVSVAGGTGQQNNFTIGVDWTNTLFFFNAAGDTNALFQVMYNVPGNRTIKIFGADLVPSQLYYVLVDNIVVTSLNSDTVGVLETTVLLSAGNHKLEINSSTTSVSSIDNNAGAIIIFPNPTKNELNIITDNLLNSEIEISNAMGEILIKTRSKSKIDVSDLRSGIYFVKVKQGNNSYNYKFVKE
jgi:Secretion system C-terminal sorting domain/Heparinase II/III-like protein